MKTRHSTQKPQHPQGWHPTNHYFKWGACCGQSCPCCRAYVYSKGDSDSKLGSCPICIEYFNSKCK